MAIAGLILMLSLKLEKILRIWNNLPGWKESSKMEVIFQTGKNPPSWPRYYRGRNSPSCVAVKSLLIWFIFDIFSQKTFVFYHTVTNIQSCILPSPPHPNHPKWIKQPRSSVQFLVYWIKALVALKDWLANLGGFWLEHWGVCPTAGVYISPE